MKYFLPVLRSMLVLVSATIFLSGFGSGLLIFLAVYLIFASLMKDSADKIFWFVLSVVLVFGIALIVVYSGLLLGVPLAETFVGTLAIPMLVLIWVVRPKPLWAKSDAARFFRSRLFFAFLPMLISAICLIVAALSTAYPLVSWAMSGDQQNNVVSARRVVAAGGEELGKSATFTQDLIALAISGGRSGIRIEDVLTHDVMAVSALWAAVVLLTSVLLGLSAWSLVPKKSSPFASSFVILVAATFPLTWYVTGFATMYGFLNASLSFLLLILAWMMWQFGKRNASYGLSGQLILCVIVLATWPPLVLVPLTFSILTIVLARKMVLDDGLPLLVASMILFVAYIVFNMAPVLTAGSGGLQLDGSIMEYRWTTFLLVVGLSIAVAYLVGSGSKIWDLGNLSLGVLGFSFASVLGVGYLVWGNRNLASVWIYYPIKFAWLSGASILIITSLAFCSWVLSRDKSKTIWLGLIGLAATIGTIMLMNPVPRGQVLPLIRVAVEANPYDGMVPEVSLYAGSKTFFSKYKSAEVDTFADQWLFQLASKSVGDPVRDLAYHQPESVTDVCNALATLGPNALLITSSSDWALEVSSTCSHESVYAIAVRGVS